MKRAICFVLAVVMAAACAPVSLGRDLAGIPWADFVKRSELVFRGVLMRAEFVDWNNLGPDFRIRYTYRIYAVYKGEALQEVTFIAPDEEEINKAVGRPAIVALRKVADQWVLSVDQRSCWTYDNKMEKDFGGLGVYEITLLHDLPAEFSETVEIQVRYGDELKVEPKKLFTAAAVMKPLKAALAAVK